MADEPDRRDPRDSVKSAAPFFRADERRVTRDPVPPDRVARRHTADAVAAPPYITTETLWIPGTADLARHNQNASPTYVPTLPLRTTALLG
jgi:hypothetical protein